MCDLGGTITDVVANVATGGLYSVGEKAVETVETGSPAPFLGGFGLGMAATGGDALGDIDPNAERAWYTAGSLMGSLGSAGAFSGLPGFEAAGTVSGATGTETLIGETGDDLLTAGADTAARTADPALAMGQEAAQVGPVVNQPAMAIQPDAAITPQGLSPSPMNPGDLPSTFNPNVGISPAGLAQEAAGTGILAGLPPPGSEGIGQWFANLPDSTKGLLAIVGGQAVAGSLGGVFQSMSASDKLELEKLINDQRQGQINYRNKNNQSAPLLRFASKPGPAGLLKQVPA